MHFPCLFMPNFKPDLIVRLPNWVGDVIMSLPALERLSQQGLKLALIGKPWIHDLLQDMPYQLHSLKDRKSLKAIPCDKLLLLTNSFSSAWQARLAGKKCLGYATDGRGLLLQKALKKPKNQHETTIFQTLAVHAMTHFFHKKIQINEVFPPQLHILKEKNKQLLQSPYVVLCPFAHGLTPDKKIKKWPEWPAFSKAISELKPIICPGPNEEAEANILYPDLIRLNQLSLYEYAQVLANASLVIANDSGPMHISAALDTPTIGIFGVSDPLRTGPKQATILGSIDTWPSIEEVLLAINPYLTRIKNNL